MPSVYYLPITFLLGAIILKYKSIYMKIFLLVMWYPLVILAFFHNEFPVSGILSLYSDQLLGKISEKGLNYYMIGYIVFCAILYPLRKSSICFPIMNVSQKTRWLLVVLTIVGAIPVLNTHSGGFMSGTFYQLFGLLLFLTHQKKDVIWFFHLCLCLGLIVAGERVDSLLMVVFLFLVKGGRFRAELVNNKKLFLGGISLFLLLVSVGFLRSGDKVTAAALMASFVSQRTVCDVVYIYLTAISYVSEHACNLSVLQTLYMGFLPGGGVAADFCYTNFLGRYMPNPGGGLFFSEGVVAFGYWGVVLYIAIAGLIIRKLVVSKSIFAKFAFTLCCVMACRLNWYGIVYIYKPIVILYVLYKLFGMRKFVLKQRK